MESFKFSYIIKPASGIAFTKHIEFVERETCIAISCDSYDADCTHLLEPEDFAKFLGSLGIGPDAAVLDAVRATVRVGREDLVDEKVHAIVEPAFVWYDFDSPFYGDKYVESVMGEDGTWIRVK